MRVLLDESVPRGLKRFLPDHQVLTVQESGWAGTQNGALLRRAEMAFDVFVTADRGIRHQQNLSALDLGVVLLVAQSNRMVDYAPLAEALKQAVADSSSGSLIEVQTPV